MSKSFAALRQNLADTNTYWVESAKNDVAASLDAILVAKNLGRAQFAKKVGVSPAYVTKVLRGDENLSIESMVKLARGAGARVSINFVDEAVSNRYWISVIHGARTVERENFDWVFRRGSFQSPREFLVSECSIGEQVTSCFASEAYG